MRIRGLGRIRRIRRPPRPCPRDFTEEEVALYRLVESYTMTSPEAVRALSEATRYVVERGIPGAVVECGVWRGGSAMVAARTLLDLGTTERDLYLFDTFEGMTEPTSRDRIYWGEAAAERLEKDPALWARADLEGVQRAMATVGYPKERITYVKGPVEETVPARAPERIALLRLDTDWYESTKHELVHLYPRLETGGVLIIDDYGWWQGAREATDEYFAEQGIRLFLQRIDDEGRRFAIKT